MPRATVFSDKTAAAAKPAEKVYRLHAGEQGLFLRVSPTGTKAWELRYTEPGSGKQQTFVIGKYDAVGVAKARDEAKKIRALIADGVHPTVHKRVARVEKSADRRTTFKAM